MCQDWILFINDFSINKAPESNGRKFYLTSSGSSSPSSSFTGSPAAGPDSKSAAKSSTPKSALARMRLWAGGESRSRSERKTSYAPGVGVAPLYVVHSILEHNGFCALSLCKNCFNLPFDLNFVILV